MEEKKNKEWLKVYLDNYNGRSEQAKSIETFLKKNYKDSTYLPWATMERLTFECDPDAEYTVILNNKNEFVHTIEQITETIQGETITKAVNYTHFVRIELTFLGKTFTEDYPIQNNTYDAIRFLNSNDVNKALQRAKAKIASRATGIGLSLYEGKDLQFDETPEKLDKKVKAEVKTPTVINAATTEVPTKWDGVKQVAVKEVLEVPNEVTFKPIENTTPVSADIAADKQEKIDTLIKSLKQADEEAFNLIMGKFNKLLLTKWKFTLKFADLQDEKALSEKLNLIPKVEDFKSAFDKALLDFKKEDK